MIVVKFFVLFVVMLCCGPAWAGNNSGAAFSTWPGTNVTTCYDADGTAIPCPSEGEPYYGQDGNCPGPARSYTLLGGGTMVRDNVTGLVWEVKTDKDGTQDYSNPHDADNTYTWCDTDATTNGGDSGTCGANDTEDFIDALNAANFGGYSDWRLPTLKELVTLVDYSRTDPAIAPAFFPGTVSSYYWSATTNAHSTDDAWGVSFSNGTDGSNTKTYHHYVRCVRGGQ